MSNQHTFDTTIGETRSFSSQIQSQHSFSSQIISSREFESTIEGFPTSESLRSEFAQSLSIIVANLDTIFNMNNEIIIPDVTMSVNQSLEDVNQTFPISFPMTLTMLSNMRMDQDMGVAEFKTINNFVERTSLRETGDSVEFIISQLTIDAIPTVQNYFLLSYFSGSLLSDMDATNLSGLDSEVV